MNKAIKNTIAIIIIIIMSVGLGYAYDKIATSLEKKSHPVKYGETVNKYSAEYGVPPEVIFAVIKAESGFRNDVESEAGAIGLMQIMPATYKEIAVKLGETETVALLYDPETNIKYGTFYLRLLYDRFDNSWEIAFAAYNAGPTRVSGWLNNPEYINENEIVYIPIEETRNYVKRVSRNREVYKKLYFSND